MNIMKLLHCPSFSLLLVAAIVCTSLVQGSPIESNRQQDITAAEVSNQQQQSTEDLKRLSNGTNKAADRDELDNGASSNLLSVMGDLDGSEDLDDVKRQLLQSEGSHLLAMGLLPGKRRLDDNTALASTGQARGNRFIMPEASKYQQQLLGANSNRNNYVNEALLDDPKLDAPERRLKMMGSQRRDMADVTTAMAERRQLNIRPTTGNIHERAPVANYNNYVSNQNPSGFRSQETGRKRSASSRAPSSEELNDQELDREVDNQSNGDIFKDDGEEKSTTGGGAEKRNDDQADYDGEDDEVEESKQRGSNAKLPNARSSSVGPQVLDQRFKGGDVSGANNPMRGIEDAAEQQQQQQHQQQLDEDSESTNLKAKKSRPGVVEVVVDQNSNGNSKLDKSAESADEKLLNASLNGDEDEAASQVDKSATDLQTAAGHHHGHSHGHYYQYAGSPKKKAWKFGFKRGNHKHTISREEKGYKNKFHSSFKWHAKEKCKKHHKCESKGKMTWHYEHHDKKKHHHY